MTDKEWLRHLDVLEEKLEDKLVRIRLLKTGAAHVTTFQRQGHYVKRHWVGVHKVRRIVRDKQTRRKRK